MDIDINPVDIHMNISRGYGDKHIHMDSYLFQIWIFIYIPYSTYTP